MNALGFHPGIVGGHYIGADPYYFTNQAEKMGYHSQIKENMDKLQGKIVFDTRKCCDLPGTYRL